MRKRRSLQSKRLRSAMHEVREHMEINGDWDENHPLTDDDVLDSILSECGMMPGLGCQLAGTEFCDWECPFS